MDPDETMTTSTSSSPSALHDTIDADEGFEDDNLYPDDMNNDNDGDHSQSDRPHTPANDHLNAAAPGELSPPRSQRQSQSEDLQQQPTSRAMANGTATRSSARVAAMQGKSDAEAQAQATAMSDDRDGRGKPGWAWRSKKAQEDRQRAWENIVDRDFSLKEFGDVMLQGKAQVSG
ncbi:uncharacterized protein Z520_09817 [Fonsecaea multimorphosa CBS 102226]|uniref:Uncharacterized protein n=1 Tax=Fonsecaea multimorphosa CBS 102226 TaxID=1442371 RepID=A0A0D2IBB9_9EURO|nr:uncharacterized protein Z520_09817 [Fonsecaea multimorphosa CBS 102226]KIX94431.1 hypothetical protein Z520_09817 [Fonsecaea multimorphosa CBS 102226]OAL20012.1 hypothetical protein AYO22_09162 [Fonsecaea multimorphosa]